MLIQTTISEQDLQATGLSPKEFSDAILLAVQSMKHPVSSAPVALPSAVNVLLYKEGTELKVYY